MRILLDNNHIPHAYHMAMMLPDLDFDRVGWDSIWRSVPPNLEIISQANALLGRYDIIITDRVYGPIPKAKRVIVLQHCEHDSGNQTKHGELRETMDLCDLFVSVSGHKLATTDELSFSHKARVIPFAFDSSQIQPSKNKHGIIAIHNATPQNTEISGFLKNLSQSTAIALVGQENEGFDSCERIKPAGFNHYSEIIGSKLVFVNVVCGNAFGMSAYEAMLAGCAVVTLQNLDLPSWIKPGWNCEIATKENMSDIARGLMADPGRANRLGSNARKCVQHHHSYEKIASMWTKVILG